MEIRKSLTNAVQLLGLLCLLFWSFTWNTPNSFDLSEIRKSFKEPVAKPCLQDVSAIEYLNKDSFVIESFKTVKYVGGFDWKVSSAEDSLLPPFNDWKEKELTKQERNEERDKIVVPKTARRKLNYASSKCGAKILASNQDSKHRVSILNEKADEYMLNSCKIKVWFVVELCDTIEATQSDKGPCWSPTAFLAKLAPIVGPGHQHSLVDAVTFPSYIPQTGSTAERSSDLAGQGCV
ncbi:SUN domain-containing ossification factor [Trichonephila clavipes]|nr:SUN domain-containing ossification factor [Trichonephila clavipes]